jgi:hypothetical protein
MVNIYHPYPRSSALCLGTFVLNVWWQMQIIFLFIKMIAFGINLNLIGVIQMALQEPTITTLKGYVPARRCKTNRNFYWANAAYPQGCWRFPRISLLDFFAHFFFNINPTISIH